MHTVELMEQGIAALETLGYGVREEYLGGAGGGGCEIAGRKWVFVDIALSKSDQLDQILEALRIDPAVHSISLSSGLSEVLGIRRAA